MDTQFDETPDDAVRKTEPDAQNGFLFIGELAKLTSTDPKTIRFYERAELLSPPRHGRFRTYLATDVKRLKNVLVLRKLGVPIAQIRKMFDLIGGDADILSSDKAITILRQHLELLRGKEAEITQQIEQTSTALHKLVA